VPVAVAMVRDERGRHSLGDSVGHRVAPSVLPIEEFAAQLAFFQAHIYFQAALFCQRSQRGEIAQWWAPAVVSSLFDFRFVFVAAFLSIDTF